MGAGDHFPEGPTLLCVQVISKLLKKILPFVLLFGNETFEPVSLRHFE